MPASNFSRRFSFLPVCLLVLLTACGTVTNQTTATQPPSTTTAGDPQPTRPTAPPATPPATTPPTTPPTPPPTPSGPEHFYFSYSGKVYGFELHDDGTLTRTPGSPYDSGSEVQNSGTPSVSVTGEFVFVPNTVNCAYTECLGTNSIATFARNLTTGELNRTQVTPVGTFPGTLLTDQTGKFLYSGEYDQLRGFSIAENGDLTPASWNPFSSAEGRLVRHPSLPIIYAISVGHMFPAGRIAAFRTDTPDGYPSLLNDMPINFKEEGTPIIKMDPNGKFLFILIDGLVQSNLFVWSISPIGELTSVDGSPFTVPATTSLGSAEAGLALDPQLRWLYVSSGDLNGKIAQYAFDFSSGSIGPLLSSTSGVDLRINTVDRRGQFLIATRLTDVLVFRIDTATGELSLLGQYSLF